MGGGDSYINHCRDFTRECLSTAMGQPPSDSDVVNTLSKVVFQRGKPKRIHRDNGGEIPDRLTDFWAYQNKFALAPSRPQEAQIVSDE